MNKPMTKQELLSYIEKTWDTAQREAWGEPPRREWVSLTDEEMHACWDSPLTPLGMKHARMIEDKLKEKNG